MKNKLFVVSNRLPLTIERDEDNKYKCRQSSGGLISSISSYLDNAGKGCFGETIWVGVPGCNEKTWNDVANEFGHTDYRFSPVFVNWKRYELYYNGFSNSLIWPLFHYFPSYADYNISYYDAYIDTNQQFAENLRSQLKDGDTVWIHDYHLLPLAGMLREMVPNITIGFFLHIPFPSYELFRVIPKKWQKEILTGMLGADLIGFHTLDYATHFHLCIKKVLKIEYDEQYIFWNNRQIKADAFPISIDYEQFNAAYDKDEVVEKRDKYLQLKSDKKMLFSVDRLDYTKGLSNRLQGYEQFLVDNPEFREKVVFALVIVPSRDGISKYAERKKLIDEYISNINSRLGNIHWQPILYQYNHLSFDELIALYTSCDVALLTPLRDGMNLVSKEFVASRKDGKGVLILSEMAGAANELTEALLINPNDSVEIADMIKMALEMSDLEQNSRMLPMQKRIQEYDVNAWATDFFSQLAEVKGLQLKFEIKFVDSTIKANLFSTYETSDRRLFLLDYDGTLIPFSKHPMLATPGEELLSILVRLAGNPKNDVFIISGRDSATLESWFGHLPINLIAEHGMKIKIRNDHWKINTTVNEISWMNKVEHIMNNYSSKCFNSFVEKKEFSQAWHYRNSDNAQGNIRALELYNDLKEQLIDLPLEILRGNKVIEVRASGMNKGIAVEKIMQSSIYDFVLSFGDDTTDEDMFIKLAKTEHAFTIKVGNKASFAKYNLHNPQMVRSLLHTISMYGQNALQELYC